MRSSPRHLQLIVRAAVLAILATVVLATRSERTPHVALGVTGFSRGEGQLWVEGSATNVGSRALVYYGSPSQVAASCQIADGWTDADALIATNHESFGFVMPGDVWRFAVAIPEEAQNVRVACCFRTAGLRQHLGAKMLDSGLALRAFPLFKILARNSPADAARSVAVWSEAVSVPDAR